jgi:probable phosphoglycerate mutase
LDDVRLKDRGAAWAVHFVGLLAGRHEAREALGDRVISMSSFLGAYFIRHGETAWSLTGQHTGRTDLGLTSEGEHQARELAPRLASQPFSEVWVSPLGRARQTCELAGLGRESRVEPDLAEWNYGEFEGRRSVDIRLEYPDWVIWRDGCPGGETPQDVSDRADRLIERLCKMTGMIALFSHGQFGSALAARWIGLPVLDGQHFALHPASISILGLDAHHLPTRVIALWNEVTPSRREKSAHEPASEHASEPSTEPVPVTGASER